MTYVPIFVTLVDVLMQEKSDKENLVYGTVEEALPNALFRVLLDGEEKPIIAYLAGKMRKFKIRVLVGDRVGVVPEPYGGKARISKRL